MNDLTARLLRHGWRIVEEDGELVLYGNGSPAAFRSEATLRAWLEYVEKAERTDAGSAQLEMDFAAHERAA